MRELGKMAQHYTTWASSETAVCGSDMVGQRNSRLDTDATQTTCFRCLAWQEENADTVAILEDRRKYVAQAK